ncbi:MAG: type II toxin-antitoxin system RelB/DinJ family antitoxin [Gammaproteobacteria bacterium]|nr:type II toxin-antitoxin system RelB/DinJ family antitoxin [Gammaproteobacteria bacterium]
MRYSDENKYCRAKVSHLTKVRAEKILKQLGLSMSEAINLSCLCS